ncbi:hypothetical protein D3C71_2091630 [compost metagenome]
MAGHAASRRQNAFGGMHAVNIFRTGFDADQNDASAFSFRSDRFFRGKDDLAGCRPRGGRQAGADDGPGNAGIDGGVQQLVER